ncbi:hypothetical protein [Oceaniradius stylonematis]|uniref:hypothetical protein n=1 Tax=Oceaniradius stylonematis TaxID=2184161 RepID=UPI00273D776D|nr:hypothetical protein [Oceaniradius stylonematis]
MRADFRAPFPKWGEGVFIFFRLQDLIALEELYGAGEVIAEVERRLSRAEGSVFPPLVQYGLKVQGDDGVKQVEVDGDIFEHMANQGITVEDFRDAVMDAFMLQTQGKTYAEAIEEAQKLRQEAIEQMSKPPQEDDVNDPFEVHEEPNAPSSSDTEQD